MIAKDIYVYMEVRETQVMEVSYQLLSLSQTLKQQYAQKDINQQVVAVLCGYQVDKHIETCHRYGADQVIVVDHKKLSSPTTQHTSKALVEIINQHNPEVFLIGATVVGRDIAPRVAASVRTGLTADATHLEVDPSENSRLLLMTRPAFGGNLYGTIICPYTTPQMSSIRPDVFAKVDYHCPITTIKRIDIAFDEKDDVQVIKRIEKKKTDVDLRKANIILAGGRSMANHLDLLHETANKLHASVGASRGLVESKKISKDVQVGQTGTTVRPSIYIACGISGAVQHTAGMDQSQTIIAINTDPNASIFNIATLGIVADALEVLEKLPKYI